MGMITSMLSPKCKYEGLRRFLMLMIMGFSYSCFLFLSHRFFSLLSEGQKLLVWHSIFSRALLAPLLGPTSLLTLPASPPYNYWRRVDVVALHLFHF